MTGRIEPGFRLAAALILCTLVIYGVQAFALHPWTLPDDARQFLSWTSRVADPASRSGDVLADYWQETAPPLYRAMLYAAAAIGIGPVLLAKLLAFVLIPASLWLVWRLAAYFADDGGTRLLATLCVMAALVHNDSLFSGTPRAFASPLIMLALLGMAAGRDGLTVAALLLLGLVYPAPAITCLGIYGLWLFRWRFPLHLALSWRAVLLWGVTAALIIGSALLFKAGIGDWGPTLRFSEVGQVPTMSSYAGRSSIVGPDGGIAWLCSARIGYLPAIVNCRGNMDPRLLINLLLSVVPMLALWIGAPGAGRQAAFRLFPYALVASLLCYLIAAFVAFAFHLPARYSQPVLLIVGPLAVGLVLGRAGKVLAGRWSTARPALAAALLLAVAVFATPKTRLAHAADPDLLAYIARTPSDTRIAGIASDLSFVPALTGRTLLASPEHDIPYHRRYHAKNQEGLRAALAMARLGNRAALAAEVRRYGVDLLVFDKAFLATGVVPPDYRAAMLTPARVRPALGGIEMLREAGCPVVEASRWVAIVTSCLRRAGSVESPLFQPAEKGARAAF